MQQALHIFRKDVRFLWLPIAIALGLTAAFAWTYSAPRPNGLERSVTMVLVLAWWYLTAAAVYKEALAGDRQFWVTRPYRWTSLLAAKALFFAVFLHVPLLAADLAILAAQGFRPSLHTLIWRQIGLAGLVILPAAALASVTRTLAGLAMAGVAALTCIVLVFAGFDTARNAWRTAEWVRGSAILAVLLSTAAATLAWQYATRRTAGGRGVAVAGFTLFLGLMIAPPFGGWIEARTPAEPAWLGSIRVFARESLSEPFSHVWLRIAGVPEGMRADAELVSIAGQDRQGAEWRSQWAAQFAGRPTGAIRWNGEAGGNGISLWLEPWCPLAKPPVNLRASVILAISGPHVNQNIRFDGRLHSTALGRCSFQRRPGSPQFDVTCWNPEYAHEVAEVNGAIISVGPYSYIDYLSASPVLESTVYVTMPSPPGDTITLTTNPGVTRIRRDVEIPIEERR